MSLTQYNSAGLQTKRLIELSPTLALIVVIAQHLLENDCVSLPALGSVPSIVPISLEECAASRNAASSPIMPTLDNRNCLFKNSN
jgi:hypothetical protein